MPVAVGGCVRCSEEFRPPGRFHLLMMNGEKDIFAKDGCEESLARMAEVHQCTKQDVSWKDVDPSLDPEIPIIPEEGKGKVQIAAQGMCGGSDLVALRVADENHELAYKKAFRPKLRTYDLAYLWLQGKVRTR